MSRLTYTPKERIERKSKIIDLLTSFIDIHRRTWCCHEDAREFFFLFPPFYSCSKQTYGCKLSAVSSVFGTSPGKRVWINKNLIWRFQRTVRYFASKFKIYFNLKIKKAYLFRIQKKPNSNKRKQKSSTETSCLRDFSHSPKVTTKQVP